MISFLSKIRTPLPVPFHKKLLNPVLVFIVGVILGAIAKILDETPSNLLPHFLEVLDLRNFLSRLGIWMFLSVVISIFSKSPLRAAINVILFLVGVVGSYYLYTILIVGFYPKSYMMLWIAITLISPFLAYVCWYAKGTGIIATIIASLILAFMARQAFSFGFWYFRIKYFLELLLLVLTIVCLYKTPKQILIVFILGIIISLFLSPLNMFFGML